MFRGMKAERIKEVLGSEQNYVVSRFKKGDVMARRDTAYSGLMILLGGSAVGEMVQASGKVVKIDAIEAPQLIAPAFLFGGYNRLPIDVIADSDVEVMVLHRGFIFELMQEHVLILSNFIDILSDRANVWSRKIYFLSFRSIREKLASYLLDSGRDTVTLPENLSDYFSATRNSVQMVVDDMVKKHFIAVDGDNVTILNRPAIEAIFK